MWSRKGQTVGRKLNLAQLGLATYYVHQGSRQWVLSLIEVLDGCTGRQKGAGLGQAGLGARVTGRSGRAQPLCRDLGANGPLSTWLCLLRGPRQIQAIKAVSTPEWDKEKAH